MAAVHESRGVVARPNSARAAARHPKAEADYLQGLQHAKSGNWAQAVNCFARAVQRNPKDAVFLLNLADAYSKMGALDKAIDTAKRAAEFVEQPELAIAITAQCLALANRHEEIIAMVQALDLDRVQTSNPHFALGNAFFALNRYAEAITAFLGALQRDPKSMPAYVNLAGCFHQARMYVEAHECFQTAMLLGANQITMLSAMTYQALHACRWDLLATDLTQLRQAMAHGKGQPVPFHLLTIPSTRAEQQATGYAYWTERCATLQALPVPGKRIPGSRIRIGYVSGDVFRHASAYLMAELIENHDRSRFDVFLYSHGHDDGSAIRQRIIAAAGAGWVEANRMSDEQIAQRVRQDNIDILVDCKGYTFGNRVGIFALHPARVQVNYLGYPGTLGAPCYEYIIGDSIVTPLEHAADYSEKIAQMPHCYQPNDRKRPIGPRPTRASCGLPEQGFVFCSFTTCYKITAEVFDGWCRLLGQVPGSVLWLYQANDQARVNLLREAQQRGIAPERIVWAPHVDLAEHLGRLQLADLCLDTFPVTAHTTASDALWAGVPLVTAVGETFVSRVASSVLNAAGLGELVCRDIHASEKLALELARDPLRLRRLRDRLAKNRKHCALFDSLAYQRDIEELFVRMITAWDEGGAPRHLPAAAS